MVANNPQALQARLREKKKAISFNQSRGILYVPREKQECDTRRVAAMLVNTPVQAREGQGMGFHGDRRRRVSELVPI